MDDAVVVGSGPNGLAAAVELVRGGASVLVLEGRDEIGGGTRSAALTLLGFCHDVCSGCHPMAILSRGCRSSPAHARSYSLFGGAPHTGAIVEDGPEIEAAFGTD
jgi:phytoene dehydrogenase-like protein